MKNLNRNNCLYAALCTFSIAAVFVGCAEDSPLNNIDISMSVYITPQETECIHPGESIEFSMSFDRRGKPPYSYNWSYGGSGVPDSSAENPGPVTFPEKGYFTIKLTVVDAEGREASALSWVRVKDDCGSPVASIDAPVGDVLVALGTTISFAGSATGGDSPYRYTWSFSGPGVDLATGQNPSKTFSIEGVWNVHLVATDFGGNYGTDDMQVTVVAGGAWNGVILDPPFTSPDGISIAGPFFGGASNQGMIMFYGTGGMVGYDVETKTWTENLLPGSNILSGITLSGTSGSSKGAGSSLAGDQRSMLFGYTNLGAFVTYWVPEAGEFGMVRMLPGSIVRDAVPYAGAPDATGFIHTGPTTVTFEDFDPLTGFFTYSLGVSNGRFPGLNGDLISAFARNDASSFVTVTDASPGQLYINPRDEYVDGVLVGEIGNNPRQIRVRDELCVISCFESDELWIATWDSEDVVTIVGSVAVGDGPIGIDLLSLGGGEVAVVSTGFLDNTYTITVLDATGAVVSNTTTSVPDDCLSPPHAAWVPGPNREIVFTCNESDWIFIVPSGL